MFWAEIWKISDFFYLKNFQFLVVKFSIYLTMRVFVMYTRILVYISKNVILVQSVFIDTKIYILPRCYERRMVLQGNRSICGKVYCTEKICSCKVNSIIDYISKNVILVQSVFIDTEIYILSRCYTRRMVLQGNRSICGKVYCTEKMCSCKVNSITDYVSKNVIFVQNVFIDSETYILPRCYTRRMVLQGNNSTCGKFYWSERICPCKVNSVKWICIEERDMRAKRLYWHIFLHSTTLL